MATIKLLPYVREVVRFNRDRHTDKNNPEIIQRVVIQPTSSMNGGRANQLYPSLKSKFKADVVFRH